MLDTDLLSSDERIEFLQNIRRARDLADKPCLQLGERLGIPLTARARGLYLAMLDDVERTLKEPWA